MGTGSQDAASAFPAVRRELSDVVAVAVPAIADPDLASVDVDVSAAFGDVVLAVGDNVRALPQEAMEASCRVLNAYVIAADSVRVVFGSVGANVVGGNKNFKFLVDDVTG